MHLLLVKHQLILLHTNIKCCYYTSSRIESVTHRQAGEVVFICPVEALQGSGNKITDKQTTERALKLGVTFTKRGTATNTRVDLS